MPPVFHPANPRPEDIAPFVVLSKIDIRRGKPGLRVAKTSAAKLIPERILEAILKELPNVSTHLQRPARRWRISVGINISKVEE